MDSSLVILLPIKTPQPSNLSQPHATSRNLEQPHATSRHLAQLRQPFAARHHFRPPLNKRILFRIVTTIPPKSTQPSPNLFPHRPTCPSNPDTWRASTPYMPHLSLKPGHMARFNTVSAPHVPKTRTHGAPRRPTCPTCPSDPDSWRASTPFCPTCPSTPDTWRTSTAYMPHMSLRPGHMAQYIMALALIKIFQGYSQPPCTLSQGFSRFGEYPH